MSDRSKSLNLLSIDVFVSSVDSIDNQKLCTEISSFGGELDSTYVKNEHHTYYEDKVYPFGQEEAEKLITALGREVDSVLGKEMEMTAIWTLTLGKGESVSYHSHKSNLHPVHEEHYSIAYYANAPEGSANLIFDVTACNTIERTTHIKPEPGMLVVFNSFIGHMTDRHNSDVPRVVISANFSPKKMTTEPSSDWSAYGRKESLVPGGLGGQKGLHIWSETPFGGEYSVVKLIGGGEIEVISERGDSHRAKAEIIKSGELLTSLRSEFELSTPMVAKVSISLDSSDNGKTFEGKLRIGEYVELPLKGTMNYGS
jgi:hypothetical protein